MTGTDEITKWTDIRKLFNAVLKEFLPPPIPANPLFNIPKMPKVPPLSHICENLITVLKAVYGSIESGAQCYTVTKSSLFCSFQSFSDAFDSKFAKKWGSWSSIYVLYLLIYVYIDQ
jgi:hypothetical protein